MLFEIIGLPISTNQSLMAVNGRLIHTTAARQFRTSTELAFQNQLEQAIRVDPSIGFNLMQMIDEPLYCHIQLYSSWVTKTNTIRKKDLANHEKLLLDSLISVFNNKGYTIDDSQIYLLLMTKHDNKDLEDKTVIRINKLSSFSL
jgi:Holliday junction resolvase RusA-like endonuclease